MTVSIEKVVDIAKAAGDAIMNVYKNKDFSVAFKYENSPLTQADMASHILIMESLTHLDPSIPIISEENDTFDWDSRKKNSQYWLVDPLDGTKEFIKRNDEFTVNIALIKDSKPILGVVYAPAKELLYYAVRGIGAYKAVKNFAPQLISVKAPPKDDNLWRIVGSRSHKNEEFESFIKNFPNSEVIGVGSSLKLCFIAEGRADIYPRLGLTSEWDTAAAQAIVEAAGGQVVNYETQQPLAYNQKDSLLNPHFIACADPSKIPLINDCLSKKPPENKHVVWQDTIINKRQRAERFKQKPSIIWFTGLSGSGKSTSAIALENRLFKEGYSTYLLDGDNVRHGLCSDLGFSDQDRVENIRRVGEVAKLMVDAGMIVLASFISPFIREREMVRNMVNSQEFIEVYMSTPLAICEARDVKQLYRKARAGEIKNFTGIDSPYEIPKEPELTIDTQLMATDKIVDCMIDSLRKMSIIE
ncbi:3'(2'),5'-bisphosphate nucleotidase CysQ [Agarilytica rhodophyticola]|uniref:3'(2'),5'-bisphosphate nucleotidase CysQ n=1 Tax=Agarilytica rhodophyticola TaxID=1737490 RepID=UPI002481CC7A|nr:3'(2'),5'-bisphosphate nucleotidase CysQ [Agarilytica rhodophyticola]